MLKRDITYETFDGEEVTETFYFNLSKVELIELEVQFEGGFGKMLERIVETNDNASLVTQFKDLILMSYGIKSEDGKRFIKNDKLREEFAQTAAYESLFMELASDDKKASVFLTSIMPRDLAAQVTEQQKLEAAKGNMQVAKDLEAAKNVGTIPPPAPRPPTN